MGEVGIIVLGVFIALAAQQAVDDAKERAEAREARKLIRDELSTYLGRLESYMSVYPCSIRRLDEVQRLLDTAQKGEPIETPRWIGRPQFWTLLTVRWDAAAQSGRAALIPSNELAEYGAMYDWMGSAYDSMLLEQTAWSRLRAMEHVQSLSPEAAFELNLTVQDARYRAWRIKGQIEALRETARRLQLPITRNALPGSRGTCVPMDTPREIAARLSNGGQP